MAEFNPFLDVVKQAVAEDLRERGYKVAEDAPQKYKGKAFTRFYVSEIAGPLHNFEEDEISDGLRVDGRDDLNVDFAYCSEESCLVIQSKYRTGKKQTFERDEIAGFFGIYERVMNKEYLNANGNEALVDILDKVTKKTQLRCVLISTIAPSEENLREFSLQETTFRTAHPKAEAIFELKGLVELKDEYTRARSIDQAIPERVAIPIEPTEDTLTGTKGWAYLDLTRLVDPKGDYTSIVCSVKGSVIKNLYKHHKESLFNHNIRGYLGKNPINKKMASTIADKPGEFFYCNNGISAICTAIELRSTNGGNGRELVCLNLQIINGAQTTTTICTTRSDENLNNIRVLLRITRAEELKKEKGLNRAIIRYNNSQTTIRDSDFRANDDVQFQLERELKDFRYRPASPPVKSITYLPKRRALKKQKDCAYLTMERLAKVLFAFEKEPLLFQGKPKLLFDISDEGKYWDVFGLDEEEQQLLPPDRVKEIAFTCCLWFGLSDWLALRQEKLEQDSVEYQSTLAVWFHVAALGVLYRLHYEDATLRKKLWNKVLDGEAFTSKGFMNTWFKNINEIVLEKLEDMYDAAEEGEKPAKSTKPQGFNFRNWCRKPGAWANIERKLERSSADDYPCSNVIAS